MPPPPPPPLIRTRGRTQRPPLDGPQDSPTNKNGISSSPNDARSETAPAWPIISVRPGSARTAPAPGEPEEKNHQKVKKKKKKKNRRRPTPKARWAMLGRHSWSSTCKGNWPAIALCVQCGPSARRPGPPGSALRRPPCPHPLDPHHLHHRGHQSPQPRRHPPHHDQHRRPHGHHRGPFPHQAATTRHRNDANHADDPRPQSAHIKASRDFFASNPPILRRRDDLASFSSAKTVSRTAIRPLRNLPSTLPSVRTDKCHLPR